MDSTKRSATMTHLLEIRNLQVKRNKSIVLEVDHLSVEKGKVLAVVGHNGAGKSTLFNINRYPAELGWSFKSVGGSPT